MRAALLLACLVLPALGAPALAGPAPRLELTLPPLPLVPPGGEVSVQGNLTYGHDEPANRTRVTLAPAGAPAWLTARLEPGSAWVQAVSPDGRALVPVRLTVGVAAGTPALEQHTLRILLAAEPNPPLEGANATATLVVRVGFLGRVRAEPVEPVTQARPGEPANVGLRLVNEGNGPTRVTLEGAGPPGLVLVAPPPVVLEVPGQERVVNVSILASEPGAYPLRVRLATSHAFDPSLVGEPGEARAQVQVASQGLPLPGGALAAGALVLAARARRMRRARRLAHRIWAAMSTTTRSQ